MIMDNITKWMVRGACGAVILSSGLSFTLGAIVLVRGKQLMRDVAVLEAVASADDKCSYSTFRYSYPEGSPKVRGAVEACKRDVANSVSPWWTFKSPVELFLFP